MRGALATPRATRGARRDAATVGRRGRATRARATTRGDATTTTTTTTTTRRRALVALVALANARRANKGSRIFWFFENSNGCDQIYVYGV